MSKTTRLITILLAILTLAACGPKATPPPTVTPVPSATATPLPTHTPEPTATPQPTDTPKPTLTPFPTPAEVAPEKTFAQVGNVAKFSGEHGISGKAVIAGLQTLIIQTFNYDGKGPKADVRLVKGQDYENPAVILLELDQRPYENEFMLLRIPSSAGPGTADSIAIYCPETGKVYATAKFE